MGREPALCLQERPRSPDPGDCQRHAGPSQQPSQHLQVQHTDLPHHEPAQTSLRDKGCHPMPGFVQMIDNLPSERSNIRIVIFVIIALSSSVFRLHSGWSVKTATINQWKQPDPLTSSEQQMIVEVIKRAEQMEKSEKTRLE